MTWVLVRDMSPICSRTGWTPPCGTGYIHSPLLDRTARAHPGRCGADCTYSAGQRPKPRFEEAGAARRSRPPADPGTASEDRARLLEHGAHVLGDQLVG